MMVYLSVCTLVLQRRRDRGTLTSRPFQYRALVTAAAVVLLWAVDGKGAGLAFRSLSGWLADSKVLACSWLLLWQGLQRMQEGGSSLVIKDIKRVWYNCFKSIWTLSVIWENHLVCHSYVVSPVCRDYTLSVSYPSAIKFTLFQVHISHHARKANLYFSHLSASLFLSCALMYIGACACAHVHAHIHTRLIPALFFSCIWFWEVNLLQTSNLKFL